MRRFLMILKYRFLEAVGLTGVHVITFDENGKKRKVDVANVLPGTFVTTFEGVVLKVTGYAYDDGIDYVIPCSDGCAYSPLLLV